LRIILHLVSPPLEKLMLAPSQEACKQAFMGQLKEADFIRWGNTKRITGLRKVEQDGIWESIKERARCFIWCQKFCADFGTSKITLTSTGVSLPK